MFDKTKKIIKLNVENCDIIPDKEYKVSVIKNGNSFLLYVTHKKEKFAIFSYSLCKDGDGIMNWDDYKEKTQKM